MASRIPALPRLPRFDVRLDPAAARDAGRRALAWRPPQGDERKLALWRTAWLPFWLSSDVPAPHLPARDRALPPGGPAGDHVARFLGHLVRRIWLQRILTVLLRAAWLPLLIGCGWLLLELRGGPELDVWVLGWIGAILMIPAVVFAVLVKPTRRQVARMLDHSFGLQDRMLTAVNNVGTGVPGEGERAPIVYLQMADAANVVTDLRAHPAFRIRPPVRELVLAIACGLLMASLFFLRGVGGEIPTPADTAVPAFVPAAERLAEDPQPEANAQAALADAPTAQEVQETAERSGEARQDLSHLADALADQAVTRAAAEAIERGDYEEAADLIRDVAQNADQLSPSAREGLANDLEQAAAEMSPGSENLAEASRDAASGLRAGGEAAKSEMSDLGDAVEQTAEDIVSQRELADQMRQAQAADAQRGSSGEQSGSESGGEPGEGSEGQQGNDSSGAQEGSSGEPGEGADAQPGEGGQEGNQGEGAQPGEGEQGGEAEGEGGEGQAGEPAGESGQPGEGQQPGEGGEGAANAGQPGEQGEGAQSGAGAGEGDAQNGSASEGGQPSEAGSATDPNVSDPNVKEGNGEGGEGAEGGEAVDPRASITLSRSPDASGVQTSGNGGSSSLGSGAGASVAGGDSVQGEVGAAGPDSNHVPPEYRGIVEDYFSDPEG